YGQTSVPASATNIVAIAAGWQDSMALRADGSILIWGQGHYGLTTPPDGTQNIVSISAGEGFNVAMTGLGPPRFATQIAPSAVRANGSALLNVMVAGSQPLTLQWLHDGDPVPTGNGGCLLLTNLAPSSAGDYLLVASNHLGLTTNSPILVTVSPSPGITAWS